MEKQEIIAGQPTDENLNTQQLEEKIVLLETTISKLEDQIHRYEEVIRLSNQKLYGRKSEKTVPAEQLSFLDEIEELNSIKPTTPEPTVEEIIYTRRKKQKGHREEMYKELPVEVIEYDLAESEKSCTECGHEMQMMKEVVTKELEVIPATAKVIEHRKKVYACRHCEENNTKTPIITASMPERTLPSSIASAATIAHVMTQKFMFGVPLYRQETYWKQIDIEISRQTMANWLTLASDRWLSVIYKYLHSKLLERDIIHADETTLQVLREPDRSADEQSYVWHYRTGRDGPHIALYEYQTTRAHKHPKKFLEGFKGYLCTDGYQSYDGLNGVINVGCLAHARRKWDEAIKALPAEARKKECIAKTGFEYFGKLYKVEDEVSSLDNQKRYEIRLLKSKPILDEFYTWLKKVRNEVNPKSQTGIAITYCINQWDKLCGYLKDGRLYCDNNISERSIKGYVISRKNFLFCNTPKGATASVVIFSMIETAKANNIKPYEYLTYLLKTLPNINLSDNIAIENIMPWSSSLPDYVKLKIR